MLIRVNVYVVGKNVIIFRVEMRSSFHVDKKKKDNMKHEKKTGVNGCTIF